MHIRILASFQKACFLFEKVNALTPMYSMIHATWPISSPPDVGYNIYGIVSGRFFLVKGAEPPPMQFLAAGC